MKDGLPWSVKGVEPEIRDDAALAARAAGMTLGQWLNGIIRDSIVDIRAAQPPSVPGSPPVSPQQEMASPPMPPFQQPHPHVPPAGAYAAAPYPGAYHAAPPPGAYGAPPAPAYPGPPYAQPYAPPAPAYDPYAYPPPPRGYDPVEARLSHYARLMQPAAAPAQDERVLSVVDAAVGAMQTSVRESERKTAAVMESLLAMMERVQQGLPQAPAAPAQPQPSQPTSAPMPAAPDAATEALSSQLSTLMDRLAALESSIAERSARTEGPAARSGDALSQARRIESQLSDALDSLGDTPATTPQPGGVRPPPGRGGVMRPRVNVVRGGAAAVADIAARQRSLDTETAPRATLSTETQALEAIRRSIAALADQVREAKEEQARQPDLDLRNELKDLQKSVQDLAPRRIVASINESLRALSGKIEQSRQDGVRESQLAPIEKLMSDMRAAIEQVREPRGLETINSAIAHLGRRIDEIGARSIDTRLVQEFQLQFADIRRMIADVQAHSPASSVEGQIARLSEKLDTLAERPSDGRAVATVATAVEELRRHIERIDPERMLAVVDQRIADLSGLESRIDDLSTRVGRAMGAAPMQDAIDTLGQRIERRMAGLESLGARIDQLASRLDKPAAPMAQAGDLTALTQRIERRMAGIDALGARIDQLASRLDQPSAPGPGGDGASARIDALAGRIGELQHTLERKVPTQPDVKGLEMILRKLAERIEAVRAPSGDAAALDALQTQMMALAERLDRTGPAVSGLSGLEQTIGELCRVVGSIKESAVQAAQDAARAVAFESAGSPGMDPLAAEGMLLIKRDLSDMKAAQAQAETRARDAMQSVSALLESIATRLSTLETDTAAPRPGSSPSLSPVSPATPEPVGPGSRPVPHLARPMPPIEAPAAARSAPPALPPAMEMPSTAADPGLDLPLEPGIGRVQAGAGASTDMPPAADPLDPRASFIAAARRAAQAAATQSSGLLADLDTKLGDKKAAALKKGLKLDGLKAALAARRKPLLLGLAALIFALGGLKVATSLLMRDDTPEPATRIEQPQKESRTAPGLPQPGAEQAPATALAPAAPTSPRGATMPDRTVVGSIGETPPPAGTASTPAAPLPPPLETPATAPARPADVAELMKASPYKGPERLRQAAVNGNLAAIYEIGARYADGRGTARDLKLASRWLEFAAEQGFAPAQYRFGSFNREGLGMQQDAKVAFQWFMKAAEQGHILAMHNLAVLYAEGVNGSPDYASAAAWFRNAAEHGVKDSQFNIAILHVRGLGVVQDMVEAYKWFAIAAQKGDADAIKRRDEVAARLSPNQLEDAKNRVEEFRPRRPDMRANDVGAPEGGWDQAPRAPGAPQQKKSRV